MSKSRGRVKNGVTIVGALTVLVAVAIAGITSAAMGETSRVGNIIVTADGGFSPKALPKSTLTPITFKASGQIKTVDGSHPPALREVVIESDKNGSVQTKGYPECTSGKLQATDTDHAEANCGPAIIGGGKTEVEIAFAEQPPIPVKSDLLVINGGTRGGTTTFFIHAYITVPTPAAIVTTVKIKRIHKGRYGLLSVASVPKIAGGSGSVKSFSLTIDKKYTYKGKKVGIISAKCPDGKLQVHVKSVFSDGTAAETDLLRTCTPKG